MNKVLIFSKHPTTYRKFYAKEQKMFPLEAALFENPRHKKDRLEKTKKKKQPFSDMVFSVNFSNRILY